MRSHVASVLAVALVVRLALLFATGFDEERWRRPDSGRYEELAEGLLRNHTFSVSLAAPSVPETVRTPGYPAFLSCLRVLFGAAPMPVLLVQILLSIVTCGITLLLVRSLGGSPADHDPDRVTRVDFQAYLAALLVAIDLPSACHDLLILSESLFTVVLTASLLLVWLASRSGSIPLASIGFFLLGLDVLVRPIALYLIPILILWLAVLWPVAVGRRLSVAVLATLSGLLAPVSWMVRNHSVGSGLVLSSIEGGNLLLYRAAPVLAFAEGITWDAATEKLKAELARRRGAPVWWDGPGSEEARRIAVGVMREHPWWTSYVFLSGGVTMWVGPGNTDLRIVLGLLPTGPPSEARQARPGEIRTLIGTVLTGGGWVLRPVLLVAMLFGVVTLWIERRWGELSFLLTVLGVITVLSASPGAYARLRVPVTPLASVLAAEGIVWCAGRRTTRSRSD